MQQLIGQRNKVCKLRARRARTREGKPLADDQHSSTHDSSHNRRRHADWCPTRNQNKARAHALAKSADLEPSQPPPVQLGVQLIDRTQNFTRSSREGSIPIAWGWVGKLRPKAGGSKNVPVPPARYEHITLKGAEHQIHKGKLNECIGLAWTGKTLEQCLNSTQAIISASNKVEKNLAHLWDAGDAEERLLVEKTKA